MVGCLSSLTEAEREQIRAAIGAVTGHERCRAWAKWRSRLLRLRPDFRAADNARKAARGRERYHADIGEARRKSAEKERRRRARRLAASPSAPCQGGECGEAGCGESDG